MTDDPDDEGDDSSLDDSFTVPPSVSELREMSVKGLHAMLRSLGMPGQKQQMNRETGKKERETKDAMIQRLLGYLPERRPAENSKEHLRSMSHKDLHIKLRSLGLLGHLQHLNRETGKWECETKDGMIQRLLDHFAGRQPAENSEEHLRTMSQKDLIAKLKSLGRLGRLQHLDRETGKQVNETKAGMVQRLLDHFAGRQPAENSEEDLKSMSKEDLHVKLLSLKLPGRKHHLNRETGMWVDETKAAMIQRLLHHFTRERPPAENSEEHLRSMSKKDLQAKLLSLGLPGRKYQINRETGKWVDETKDAMIQRLLDHFTRGRRPAENSEEHLRSMSRNDLIAKLRSLGLPGQEHPLNAEAAFVETKVRAAMMEHRLCCFAGESPAAECDEEQRMLTKSVLLTRLVESMGFLSQKRLTQKVSGKEAEAAMVQGILADLEAEANAALEEGTASEDAADVTEMAVDDACVVLDGPPALKKQRVGCA